MELHTPERVVSVEGSVFVYQASLSTTHSTKNSHIWGKISISRVYTRDILSTIINP